VLAEVLVGVARLGDEGLDQRRSQIVAAFGPSVALDEPVAVSAARRRARHRSLRLPDAVVLATAEVLDARRPHRRQAVGAGRLTGEARTPRHLSGGSGFGVRTAFRQLRGML
jgi:hypothetical protein